MNRTLGANLLKGKVALITGCNRGIGKAILEAFAENGATIWACARQPKQEFTDYLEELRDKHRVTIYPLYFDLMKESEIKDGIRHLIIKNGPIDILVNNAGIAHGSLFQMTSVQKIREIFEINYFSQLIVTQMITRNMIKQRSGSIINVTSIAGIDAKPGNSAYGSSKSALIYFTKMLAKELGPNNIRVNAIAPGLTKTDMAELMEEKAKNDMVSSSAMNRLATPMEIANAVLFLASDLSTFINGQIIRIDGGM